MAKRHPRARLCPEITDPKKRVFLDLVPMVRRLHQDVLDKQNPAGERIDIPLEDRTITVYLHRAEGKKRPVVFEYHGGGYVFGSAAADDQFCEKLCRLSGWHVAGVDYRLAPEHRFPAQLEDAWEVIRWFREHADMLGADPDQFAVTGFSGDTEQVVIFQNRNQGKPVIEVGESIFDGANVGEAIKSEVIVTSGTFFLIFSTISLYCSLVYLLFIFFKISLFPLCIGI